MKKQAYCKNSLKTLFVTILLIISLLLTPFAVSGSTAKAEERFPFDNVNVIEDVSSAEGFSLTEYPWKNGEKAQMINFVEFAFSQYYVFDFALYVYIYNPADEDFEEDSNLNTIEFSINGGDYVKYNLIYCNRSHGAGIEGLFYKFRVEDPASNGIFRTLMTRPEKRTYKISGVELLSHGDVNATEYPVAQEYNYTGFALGYGEDEDVNTLAWTVDGFETLDLKVKSTYYRPKGNNGDTNTQDTLHSVYFAVPKTYIDAYGEMAAVKAQWLNALLKPALVTGNRAAYEAIMPYLGRDIGEGDPGYAYCGAYVKAGQSMPPTCDIYFGPTGETSVIEGSEYIINPLYLMFYAGAGDNSADNYTVNSEDLKAALVSSKDLFGGELVNGKYARSIFESVDDEFVVKEIERDDTYSLTSYVLNEHFWLNWLGIKDYVEEDKYNDVKAIQAVDGSMLTGNKELDCDNLLIAESDYQGFVEYYNENKEDNVIYLFRYMTSEYKSEEATCFEWAKDFLFYFWHNRDTNAYFFQETVNLDFDIIQVTFATPEERTVIPVVMSPMDIIYEGTPPLETTDDISPFVRLLYRIAAWALLIGSFIVAIALIFTIIKILDRILKIESLPLKIFLLVIYIAAIIALAYVVSRWVVGWIIDTINALGGLK